MVILYKKEKQENKHFYIIGGEEEEEIFVVWDIQCFKHSLSYFTQKHQQSHQLFTQDYDNVSYTYITFITCYFLHTYYLYNLLFPTHILPL